MKMILQWFIQVLKLQNGFYFLLPYKVQFDAALVKLLIRVEQLRQNKGNKTTDI